MTISELIKELETVKKTVKDMPVTFFDNEYGAHIDLEPQFIDVVVHNDKVCLSLNGQYYF